MVNSYNKDIIFIAAGDDVSCPTRTATPVKFFKVNPGYSAVLVSFDVIDAEINIVDVKLFATSCRHKSRQTLFYLINYKARTFAAGYAITKEL